MKYIILMIALCFCVQGCDNDDDSLAEKAGNTVGGAMTKFAKGVGEGVDDEMMIDVKLSKELIELGLSSTVAKMECLAPGAVDSKSISIYFIADNNCNIKSIAKAYDSDSNEIGRAITDIIIEKDNAAYVIFKFPDEMDIHKVENYEIDFKSHNAAQEVQNI